MSESFAFDAPRLFTVGTIGDPGSRTFFFQAHAAGETVSLKCEKQQAEALAEHLESMLTDLPPVDPSEPPPLIEPLPPMDLEWIVGSIGIGYDKQDDRVVLELQEIELVDEDDQPIEGGATLRLRITRGQAAAFVGQAQTLSAAGRPPCRLCGQPIDASGHVCPRLN